MQEGAVGIGPGVVSEELLHPPQQLRRLTVAEFLRGEQLLEALLLGGRCTLNWLVLQRRVRVPLQWCKEKISNLCGELRCEGGNHVVELHLLVSDVAGGKLGFHQGKPDLGSAGQKGGILTATAEMTGAVRGCPTTVGCSSAMSGSPM